MTCATRCPCCKGACCYGDNCSEEYCDFCENELVGIWHGPGTRCADYDCTRGCCEEVSGDCPYTNCVRGYNPSACETECDPLDPKPSTQYPACLDGTTFHNTVSFSGVTFSGSGDPTVDALIEAALNDTYHITRDDCLGLASGGLAVNFPIGSTGFTATVNFPGLVRVAGIRVFPDLSPGFTTASMERNDGLRSSVTSSCGDELLDCDEGVSGPPTSTAGGGNYTNADITTS